MNNTVKTLIGIVVVLVALVILNPSQAKHQAAAYDKCCQLNPKTCAIGGCNAFRYISYQSYGICSVGGSNEMNTSTFGVCGIVFATVPDL